MWCRRVCFMVMAAAIALAWCAAGWGAEARQGQQQNAQPANRRNDQRNGNTAPPPVDHSASIKARKDMADAQAALRKAKDSFDDVVRELRTRFEQSNEYRSALAAANQAQADFEFARGAVLKRLAEDPAYKAAAAKKAAAERTRDEMEAEPGSPEHSAAAEAVLKAGSELTSMEAAAMNADPVASAARRRLLTATAQLDELKKRFEASIASDPKLQSLRSELKNAEARLAAAEKALAAALQREAQLEMQRQQRIDEIRRRQREQRDRDNRRRNDNRNRR